MAAGPHHREAETLVKLAENAAVHHTVGLQARYSATIGHARELIIGGYVGRGTSVTAYATLDTLEYLLGDITDLSAELSIQRPRYTVEETHENIEVTSPDQLLLNGTLTSGAVVSAHIHDAKVTDGRTRIEIAGTEGDLAIVSGMLGPGGVQMSELRLLGSRGPGGSLQELSIPARYHWAPDAARNTEVLNVAQLYSRLADDIRTGAHTTPDFETGLHLHRLLDTIRRSAETGTRQTLTDPARPQLTSPRNPTPNITICVRKTEDLDPLLSGHAGEYRSAYGGGVGEVLVGTASWTDKTLLESGWYPPDVRTPTERLRYYASHFPVVEVDSTYYAPPAERTARLWTERTPEGFTFDVKAFSLLTCHPTRPAALPKDLREALAPADKNLYLRDVDPAIVEQIWERFVTALMPLWDAGKFGAVLFQFPRWFPIGKRNKHYILECKQHCQPLRIAVEFRNRTWMSEENQEETLDFLRSYAIPYVCVDMPQGHPCSIPPVVAATADLAEVRFHGRSDKWTSRNRYQRFGYLYSPQELKEWVPKICELARQTSSTHVIMKNVYRDYAQTNARQLADLLKTMPDCPVRPPPPLAG